MSKNISKFIWLYFFRAFQSRRGGFMTPVFRRGCESLPLVDLTSSARGRFQFRSNNS